MNVRSKLWWATALVIYAITSMTKDAHAAVVYTAHTETALTDHLARLVKQVPEGFTVISQPPFVVLGDESPETVRQRATHSVKWAVDKTEAGLFPARSCRGY